MATAKLKTPCCVGARIRGATIRTRAVDPFPARCPGAACACAPRTNTYWPGQPNPIWSTVLPPTPPLCAAADDPRADEWPRPPPVNAPVCGPPPPQPQVGAAWLTGPGNARVRLRRLGVATPGQLQRDLVALAGGLVV